MGKAEREIVEEGEKIIVNLLNSKVISIKEKIIYFSYYVKFLLKN